MGQGFLFMKMEGLLWKSEPGSDGSVVRANIRIGRTTEGLAERPVDLDREPRQPRRAPIIENDFEN